MIGQRPVITSSEVEALRRDRSPARREAIIEALGTGEGERVRAAAHALKSSAAYIGARELARLCKEVEQRAREADLVGAGRAAGELEAEARRVVQELGVLRAPAS